jgi:peptidoglycan/LPS O-acetylase OafA/YrhL
VNEASLTPALPLTDTSTDKVSRHTPSVRAAGKGRNPHIQWLRAIAALMVMLYHTGAYQSSILHDDRFQSIFPDSLGYFGVALFFAISGYLMSVAIRVQNPFMFLAHRVVRIYPLYFITILIFQAVLNHHKSFDTNTLFLMPQGKVHYPIRIEWTLVFEVAFYAGLFVIAWLGLAKHIVWIALAWLAAMAVNSLISPDQGTHLIFLLNEMPLLSICMPMAAGLLIPSLLEWKIPAWPLLGLGLVPWAAHAVLPAGVSNEYEISRWLFGVSAVLVVWGMIRLSAMPQAPEFGRLGRVLATYGDYSYALYLCHVPVIDLVYHHAGRLNDWSLWAVSVALAIVVSMALGRLDVGLYRRLRKRVEALPQRPLTALVGAYFLLFVIVSGANIVKYLPLHRLSALGYSYARLMLAEKPIVTREDAIVAAEAAGFVRSDKLKGNIDSIRWEAADHRLFVDLWAVDTSLPDTPVLIALFRDGRLIVADMPIFRRADIGVRYGTTAKTGYHFEAVEGCTSDPVVAMLYTPEKRFQVLETSGAPIVCPAPLSEAGPATNRPR